ncbi:MAG TPA: hypothetical protein VGR73_10400 [Bryobacteraceae bacterium]|nr:hypothetical protein [Bryobacteraceae bacterium]
MLAFCSVASVVASVVALTAASLPSWTAKPISQWTEEDAKQVLASSPWIKRATPGEVLRLNEVEMRNAGRMGGGQGVGLSALSPAALTGVGDPPAVRRRAKPALPSLEIRWESALPVRAAELKAHEDDPPDWQGSLYAVAVYDVPGLDPNTKALMAELKNTAFLKRDHKKDLRPVRVDLLPQVGGLTTIVYLFPQTEEITAEDQRVEFTAVLGRLAVAQYFFTAEMQFQGKLEL